MKYKLNFPEELTSRRKELGLTIKDVSEMARINYSQVRDIEHGKYKYLEVHMLEALCYALHLDPHAVSMDYESPGVPTVTYVVIDKRHLLDFMDREGITALELAKRAGVRHDYVYGVTRYDIKSVPADVARKLAKAMGMRGYELAPALAIWPGPDGQEMLRELVEDYVASAPKYELPRFPIPLLDAPPPGEE